VKTGGGEDGGGGGEGRRGGGARGGGGACGGVVGVVSNGPPVSLTKPAPLGARHLRLSSPPSPGTKPWFERDVTTQAIHRLRARRPCRRRTASRSGDPWPRRRTLPQPPRATPARRGRVRCSIRHRAGGSTLPTVGPREQVAGFLRQVTYLREVKVTLPNVHTVVQEKFRFFKVCSAGHVRKPQMMRPGPGTT
jgi:hypothetical protein